MPAFVQVTIKCDANRSASADLPPTPCSTSVTLHLHVFERDGLRQALQIAPGGWTRVDEDRFYCPTCSVKAESPSGTVDSKVGPIVP
jgi:hypothetical protein